MAADVRSPASSLAAAVGAPPSDMAVLVAACDDDILREYIPAALDTHDVTRVNGCTSIPVRPQEDSSDGICSGRTHIIGAWGAVLLATAVFHVAVAPALPDTAQVVLSCALATAATVVTCLKLSVSLSQPADPAVFGSRPLTFEEFKESYLATPHPHPAVDTTAVTFCKYCRVWVGHNTRHCHTCNKCTCGFDHHCRWLNACVGDANYRQFACFVALTTAVLIAQIAAGVYAAVDSFMEEDAVRARLALAWGVAGSTGLDVWRGVVCASTAVLVVPTVLLAHLGAFHAWMATQARRGKRSIPMTLPSDWDGSLAALGLDAVDWSDSACVTSVLENSLFGRAGARPGWRLHSVTYFDRHCEAHPTSLTAWRALADEMLFRLSFDDYVIFTFDVPVPLTTYSYLREADREDGDRPETTDSVSVWGSPAEQVVQAVRAGTPTYRTASSVLLPSAAGDTATAAADDERATEGGSYTVILGDGSTVTLGDANGPLDDAFHEPPRGPPSRRALSAGLGDASP